MYTDSDRKRYENATMRIWSALHNGLARGRKFADSIEYATKEDVESLSKPGTGYKTNAEERNPSINYVPISIVKPDGSSQAAYLVRRGRYGDKKVFGLELDDGRSFTAEGAKKLIDNLYANGGGIEYITADRESPGAHSINDINRVKTEHDNATGQQLPYKRGIIEALRDIVENYKNGATKELK